MARPVRSVGTEWEHVVDSVFGDADYCWLDDHTLACVRLIARAKYWEPGGARGTVDGEVFFYTVDAAGLRDVLDCGRYSLTTAVTYRVITRVDPGTAALATRQGLVRIEAKGQGKSPDVRVVDPGNSYESVEGAPAGGLVLAMRRDARGGPWGPVSQVYHLFDLSTPRPRKGIPLDAPGGQMYAGWSRDGGHVAVTYVVSDQQILGNAVRVWRVRRHVSNGN